MTAVLSLDLATRRYRDNGIAVVTWTQGRLSVELLDPSSIGLVGEPTVRALGEALLDTADRLAIRWILIDGPQGWKSSHSSLVHQRQCERETHTPGKTGLPGVVKPRPWTRMAEFSIGLFDFLDGHGWPRYGDDRRSHVAVETFPTQAWRSLGHDPLPGKHNRGMQVSCWASWLSDRLRLTWPRMPSHDELQATVAGLAGPGLAGIAGWNIASFGQAPTFEGGCWREGLIVGPGSGRPG